MKEPSRRLTQHDVASMNFSKFDENDPVQHQIKLLFLMGIKFGLRGSTEPTKLEVRNITHGPFSPGHVFDGHLFYGLDGLIDKTHKLSTNVDYIRETKNAIRVPYMNDDPFSDDLGGCIKRYLEKLAPGQMRLYCKVGDVDESTGKQNLFYANCPLGKNVISKLFKRGAHILGLPNPNDFAPHSLRAVFITQLANGKGVSDKERLISARQSSLGASAIYQERDATSEANKLAALGYNKKW